MILSLCVLLGFELESWDISNAFLQGLSFKELQNRAKELKLELKEQRAVYLRPPANVWRHFREMPKSDIKIDFRYIMFFILVLLKPMYGLVDAPFLWQVALAVFLKTSLGGKASLLDDNFLFWHNGADLAMLMTIHVDDLLVAAYMRTLNENRAKLEEKFGKIKRHQLPFVHNGMHYCRLENGGILVQQNESLKAMTPIPVPKGADETATDDLTAHLFRSLLCQMLFICQCHLEVATGVTQLQSWNRAPLIKHTRQANSLLKKAQADNENLGLHFPPIQRPYKLLEITDASHATKTTSYAQEGNIVALMHDTQLSIHKEQLDEGEEFNLSGPCHPLVTNTSKGKRISHSTSHAETLAACKITGSGNMVCLRFTELYMEPIYRVPHTLGNLMLLETDGKMILRADLLTDCHDLFELISGLRGVPSDKSQRLAILSLREERLSGRIRLTMHGPTTIMTSDGLTKDGTYPQLMELLKTGHLNFTDTRGKPISVRQLWRMDTYDEQDLVDIGKHSRQYDGELHSMD